MNDELKALREEVAKLRERVAVLESKQHGTPVGHWWQRFEPPLAQPQYPTSVSGSITADMRHLLRN